MPGMSDAPSTMLASACPPSTRFEDRNPTYIATTMPTTNSEPNEPNWPRVWIICGTPSVAPCAACSAMKMAPTRLPTASAATAQPKDKPKTVTDSPPVTMVSSIRFDPNHTVNRSPAVPWRWSRGIGWMVQISRRVACSRVVVDVME